MRLSVALLLAASIGLVGGSYLIGLWCVGLAVIVISGGLAAFALLRDDSKPEPRISTGATEEQRFIAATVERRRSA